MKNTPTPDNDGSIFEMPNEFTVYPSTGKPYNTTEAKYQQHLAELKARPKALYDALDNHWKWLTESEPNKLDDKLALADFLSVIVGYLVKEKKFTVADITIAMVQHTKDHSK